jgi:uncharacterized protein (DUF1330 family)
MHGNDENKGSKMCSYFIAQIEIHDWNEYELYLKGYDSIFRKFKGEVVTVDDSPKVLEGDWPYSRIVIIRFPNHEETMRWYESTEYRQLVKHRHKASRANIILAKGRN